MTGPAAVQDPPTATQSPRWLPWARRAGWAWLAIAFAWFCWEGFWYRGLYATLAEWEHSRFDWYVPVIDVVLLSLVFGGIPLLIVKLIEWRRRRREADTPAELLPADDLAAALRLAERFARRLLLCVGMLAAATVIAFAVAMLRVPGDDAAVQTLASVASQAEIREGPTRMTLDNAPARAILFRMRWPGELVHSGFVQAEPMLANGRRVTVFIEVSDAEFADLTRFDASRPRMGLLVRNGLPGTTVAFLNRAGARVTEPYYCLYRSVLSARLRYLAVSVQLLACTVIALLFWAAQRWRIRTIRRRSGTAAPVVPATA